MLLSDTYMIVLADAGDIIPFLIFLGIVLARVFKAVKGSKEDSGQGGSEPYLDEGGPQDAAEQLRRFLADMRRQATEQQTAPMPPRVPMPPVSPPPIRRAAAAPSARYAPPRPAGKWPPATFVQTGAARKAGTSPGGGSRGVAAAARSAPGAAKRAVRPPIAGALKDGGDGLREAIVLREILGPPVGMRF